MNKRIVAVTACAAGIAHTYMAAESLEKAAKKTGYKIKVETQGSIGAENVLTEKDIENEITNFNLTADKLLNNNFPPKPFDEKCNKCDFRWFCNSRKGEM